MAKDRQEMLEYALQRKGEAFRISDWEGRDYWDSQIRLIEAQQQAEDKRKLAAFPALLEALDKLVKSVEGVQGVLICHRCGVSTAEAEAALALAKGEK